jgi:hypothetical protein
MIMMTSYCFACYKKGDSHYNENKNIFDILYALQKRYTYERYHVTVNIKFLTSYFYVSKLERKYFFTLPLSTK